MGTGFRVGAVRRSAGFTVSEATVALFAAIGLDFSRVHGVVQRGQHRQMFRRRVAAARG